MTPFADVGRRGQIARLRRLAEAALGEWGRSGEALTLLRHGHNTVFRVGDGAVLRVCRPGWNSDAAIRSELEFLKFLNGAGVAAPTPLAPPIACVAPGVPEPRTCVVLRFQPGRFVRRPTPSALETLGALLRRMHDAAPAFAPSPGFERPVWDADGLLRAFAGNERALDALTSEQRGRIAAGEARVRERLSDLARGPSNFGVIHADLHLNNCVFRGGRAHPIDFDDCGFGWFAYDLAVVLVSVERWPHYPTLRDALLRGYGPCNSAEVEALEDARRVALARWMSALLTDATFGERLRPMIDALTARL